MDKRAGWMEVRGIEEGPLDLGPRFWKEQGPEAIFRAAWELAVPAHQLKRDDPEDLRLPKTRLVVSGLSKYRA